MIDQPTDNALYLRHWAANIRDLNGKSVDADRLDAIAGEIELLRTAQAALRHGLQCIAEQPAWTDHHARAAGILRQVPTV